MYIVNYNHPDGYRSSVKMGIYEIRAIEKLSDKQHMSIWDYLSAKHKEYDSLKGEKDSFSRYVVEDTFKQYIEMIGDDDGKSA